MTRRSGASASATVKDRVRTQYNGLAERYEERWSRYVQASSTATLERIQLAAGERLLDVGCGTGLLLAHLIELDPAADVAGVDLSSAMLVEARRRLPSRVPLLAGDAELLPFASRAFDVIVSSSSFHYWPDPALGLAELRRVLRPGGRLVITDWCDDYFACRLCDRVLQWLDPAHQRIVGSSECASLLADAGFTAMMIDTYRIGWLWGLMSASARRPVSQS
jgi:ubiquinone/menaquinone biosynthesis C-methylase UbiE